MTKPFDESWANVPPARTDDVDAGDEIEDEAEADDDADHDGDHDADDKLDEPDEVDRPRTDSPEP